MIAALPPLAAEPIFYIGQLPITNSYINSTLTMLGFVVFAYFVNKAVKRYQSKAPQGLLNFFESILETLYTYFDAVTHDRKKTIQFLPLVGSLFLFIVISNWIGLLPGIGSIGRYLVHHGEVALIPLFRPATTDINMTIAMAVISVVVSNIVGIAVIGFFKYANKFIKLGGVWHAVKSGSPTGILTALIEFAVGILEIISEVAKMLSLSLRLFGNVFAGEVLLNVLAGILPVFLPLPFMALEIIVGVVQAAVFSILTLVYLTIATTPIVTHHAESEAEEHDVTTAHQKDLEPTPTM